MERWLADVRKVRAVLNREVAGGRRSALSGGGKLLRMIQGGYTDRGRAAGVGMDLYPADGVCFHW